MVSISSAVTVLLTVFERKDKKVMDHELCSTTSSSIGKNPNMFSLINPVPSMISAAKASATRSLDYTCKSPIVT